MKIIGSSQRMGVAAAIMAASVLLSRLMGLIRDKVISYCYGATLESDIYFAAFVIPDFINYLLAGAYFSITLIPLLSAAFEKDEAEGWALLSAMSTWTTLLVSLLTALAMLYADEFARLAAPGFTPEAQERLGLFLRIIMPAQIFFLTGACMTAVLYLRKQFVVPALTPLVYNGGIILGGLLMPAQGMEGFCWGVLGGSFLGNLLLPAWSVWRGSANRSLLRPRLWHPGLRRFALLALPLMLGQSIVVLDEQLLRVFGSLAPAGAVSWLNYARRIMLVPVGIVAQAAGVASYPFLAELYARGKTDEFAATLRQALCTTLAVIVPLSLWMLSAAEPIVCLIFEQGSFTPDATRATTLCLQIMLLGVFLWAIQQIVGRAFYACQDTLRPALYGTGATMAALPLFYALADWFGAPGIAAASALGVALYTVFLSLAWKRRAGPAGFDGMGRVLGQGLLLGILAATPAYLAASWTPALFPGHPLTGALVALTASAGVFWPLFLLLAARLAPESFAPLFGFWKGLRRRLGR